MEQENNKNVGTVTVVFLILAVVISLFNQVQIYSMPNMKTSTPTGFSILPSVMATGVIPNGVPKIYGKELGVRYDDVNAENAALADETIRKLGDLDNKIGLTGENLERYIQIVSPMSCEYCCGAQSIITRKEDVEAMNKKIEAAIVAGQIDEKTAAKYRLKAGDAACGCAHSYAMRGLAKYLIMNHGSEYSDDEILEELGKWKTLFFPSQMQQKADVLKEKGIEFNYINLASNKYRGIESGSGSSGGMVGGC